MIKRREFKKEIQRLLMLNNLYLLRKNSFMLFMLFRNLH